MIFFRLIACVLVLSCSGGQARGMRNIFKAIKQGALQQGTRVVNAYQRADKPDLVIDTTIIVGSASFGSYCGHQLSIASREAVKRELKEILEGCQSSGQFQYFVNRCRELDINPHHIVTKDGMTVLMLASSLVDFAAFRGLMSIGGFNINAVNHVGWSALMFACRYGTADMVEILINCPSIDLNIHAGTTNAMSLAFYVNDCDKIRMLIDCQKLAFDPKDVCARCALERPCYEDDHVLSAKLNDLGAQCHRRTLKE